MNTTYKLTVGKPTLCPFSGLHHADGHLLVLDAGVDSGSLAFFAPAPDGTPGRQLTDVRPLKSKADVEYVTGWLTEAVKAGTIVQVTPAASGAPQKATEPAKPVETKAAAQTAPNAPPPPKS